jgi:hypothetical protein
LVANGQPLDVCDAVDAEDARAGDMACAASVVNVAPCEAQSEKCHPLRDAQCDEVAPPAPNVAGQVAVAVAFANQVPSRQLAQKNQAHQRDCRAA